MAEEKDKTPKSDINFEYNQGTTGLNMDNIPSQIAKGSLSYALNAAVENFDANSVTYQNEPGNELCVSFPTDYVLIGRHFISEQAKYVFFLANPATGDSEIGYMTNNDCVYRTLINARCLNFDVNFPIHKSVHKTSNCGTELYWAQPNADRRYINLDPAQLPFFAVEGTTPCDERVTRVIDCNQLRVQPAFTIPNLRVTNVIVGGNLVAGAYQFAFQYSDALGNPLSSYQPVTNPTPIADPAFVTVDFNYPVGKAIILSINNIETGGQFEFFNIAVIKTINAITSVELVGTYSIDGATKNITYSGQNVSQIRLTPNDIFEKFPFYGPADDVTTTQDVLIWKGLSAAERVNYQKIANQISLQWETWRIPPTENYSNEANATNLRGYLRDEVYPFEIVFLMRSGKQSDGFHIPGRVLSSGEQSLGVIQPTDDDYIEDPSLGPLPYWRIYNTATVSGTASDFSSDVNYKGPHKFGEFAYWESLDTYPCDTEMWGELANTPIRHHKFPDVVISPIFESKVFTDKDHMEMGNVAIYPIGVKVDTDQIKGLISASDLTAEQKADIVGFKIVRGDRTDNRSIIAKGMLRNIGKYKRSGEEFYYPNYPYNDLQKEVFINSQNNAYTAECKPYDIDIRLFDAPAEAITKEYTEIVYTDCDTGEKQIIRYNTVGLQPVLYSMTRPKLLIPGKTNEAIYYYPDNTLKPAYDPKPDTIVMISDSNYDTYHVFSDLSCVGGIDPEGFGLRVVWTDAYWGPQDWGISSKFNVIFKAVLGSPPPYFYNSVDPNREVPCYGKIEKTGTHEIPQLPLELSANPEFAYRQIFNSPETSFGQPFLGDVLKLESVMYGKGLAHFVQVKDEAKYRLLTLEAQQDAAKAAGDIAGNSTVPFFTAYNALIEAALKGIERVNFAYTYNSIADYNYTVSVPNNMAVKQRRVDIKRYLIPVVQSVGETININNFQRETSVYLRTEGSDDKDPAPLPFPSSSPNMLNAGFPKLIEVSRYTVGGRGLCATPSADQPISVVSYYASLKNIVRNQWGQIYTYQTIDTGYQIDLDLTLPQSNTVFGGDTFICRFAYKTKLPFFIDNRVGAPDDSDVFYDQLGNVGYPKYWHTSRSVLVTAESIAIGTIPNFYSYKDHRFDCANSQEPPPPDALPDRLFYDGIFYLFAYGIPNFYVETSYNVDLRQAFNDKEGDFWPHVSNRIPDDWLQESWVPIVQDNTYYYNVSYSKQNKENTFTHIPADFQFKACEYIYPFRVIYSDPQIATVNTTVNNWLTYRATSYFDFPQNYGKLTSVDGIEKGQLLARFENKSLLYNALYTSQTNTGGQVYMGQPLFSRQPPPYDFAETDLGYVGSQHKFLLKIPQGNITVDAKRGQIFLIANTQIKDLTAPGSGMNRFFTDHLAFEILRYFPDIYIDNHFNGLGLHGVYDSKFDRVIITKLDYVPLKPGIKYDSVKKEFYIENIIPQTPLPTTTTTTTISLTTSTSTTASTSSTTSSTSTVSITTTLPPIVDREVVLLSDPESFCNKSWTVSYSMVTDSWLSFHSYLPNWYMGENNFFYSGTKSCCTTFDFTLLAGALVPGSSTTSTTTAAPSTTSTTSSTTTTFACQLVGGTITTIFCDLAGTGIVTVPPPCTRPPDLSQIGLGTGYTNTVSTVIVNSTGSFAEACAALDIVYSGTDNIAYNSIAGATDFGNGDTVFLVGGTDCETVPDGYYYIINPQVGNTVAHIVGGILISNLSCSEATTTTTSTTLPCNIYLYDVDFYLCNTCVFTSGGGIGNSEPLDLRTWYLDPVTGFKFLVKEDRGCFVGEDRHILKSSGKSECALVPCVEPSTTTSTSSSSTTSTSTSSTSTTSTTTTAPV